MTEQDLVARAKFGDGEAFDRLVAPHLPRLRSLVRRLIGHPEDTRDLVQESLLRAYEKLAGFRGEAAFGTWLYTVATRTCLDHLRTRKRWRFDAQSHVRDHLHSGPEREAEINRVLDSPDHVFDAQEHIAFCFSCVARSLLPLEQAALVLRDVMGLSNREAADVLEISESVLRHHLSAARRNMQESFDGLCGIVSKSGVCYQCTGLRDRVPTERKGPPVPTLGGRDEPREQRYRHRLRVVRSAEVHQGQTQPFHDFVWRVMEHLEQQRA